jgi:ABC-2 type transport system permease protein
MRYHFSLYSKLLGIQFRSQLQYRTSFTLELFGTGLVTLLEYASLALVFNQFGTLKGWTLGQVAFLYGLAELSFGIMDMIFSGFDPSNFGIFVRQGRFDQLLLRPTNITLQILGSEFTLRRVGKIVVGILIFISALSLTSIQWSATKIVLLIMILISQILFFGGLFVIGATITFWTVESIEAMNIFTYGGTYMISHPMHIYPISLRKFFTYIIPAIFISYYPALYILDLKDPFNYPNWVSFLAPIVGLGMLIIAIVFWRIGIRYYQSTGT